MKRCFLYLAAVLLLLPLFSASALTPCAHYPGEVTDEELEEVNRIPPREGIDGSVDLCCPICHQVVDSTVLPALPVSAEHPVSSDEENPPAQEPAAQPEPAAPPEPDVQPEPPAAAQPENPAQPAPQEAPASGTGSSGAAVPSGGGSDSQNASAPPGAADVTANEQPQSGGTGGAGRTGRTGSSGGGGNGSAEETGKGQTFPFRRVKMKPKPGIRAEAAGELLWPVHGTPFQVLFSE